MKKLAPLIYLLLLVSAVSGQTNPIASTIEKPSNHFTTNIAFYPQQGFSYMTENWTLTDKNFTLHYHDLQGKLLWEYSPSSEQKKYASKAVIGSEYSDLTYLFFYNYQLIFKSKESIDITRINRKGEAEIIKLPIEEDMDKSMPIAAFASSKGFYFLIAQGHVMSYTTDIKKNDPKERRLILYFLDRQKQELKTINTELSTPKKEHEKDLGMEFVDSDDQYFYMISKEYDANQNTITQTLYTIDLEGKLVQTQTLPFALDHKPTITTTDKRIDGKLSENQYAGSISGYSQVRELSYFDNALCQVKLDLKHGYLYTIGTEYNAGGKSKQANNNVPFPTHIYVHQFDLENDELKRSFKLKMPEKVTQEASKYYQGTGSVLLNIIPLDSESIALNLQCLSSFLVYNTNFNEAEINEMPPKKSRTVMMGGVNGGINLLSIFSRLGQFQVPIFLYKHLVPKELEAYYKTCEGYNEFPKVIQAIYTGESFITIFNNKKTIETRVFPINKK